MALVRVMGCSRVAGRFVMVAALVPLFGAWALAVVSPGPDFVAVVRTAALRGRRAGQWVALGVVTGITCWATLALLGLAAVLARYQGVYWVVRAAGALFLIGYGGVVLWHARRRAPRVSEGSSGGAGLSEGSSGADVSGSVVSGLRCFRLGVVTNLSNPKAVAFFGALFASVLPQHVTGVERGGVLAVMVMMALVWFVGVAAGASVGPVTAVYRRARRGVELVTGGVFVGIGAVLMPR